MSAYEKRTVHLNDFDEKQQTTDAGKDWGDSYMLDMELGSDVVK